jgi:hypothetical protein
MSFLHPIYVLKSVDGIYVMPVQNKKESPGPAWMFIQEKYHGANLKKENNNESRRAYQS